MESPPVVWWQLGLFWSSAIPIAWSLWYFFRPAKLQARRLRREGQTLGTTSRSANPAAPPSDTTSIPNTD